MSVKTTITRVLALAAFVAVVAACGGSDSGGAAYKEPTGPAVATLTVESGNVFFKPTKLNAPKGIAKITLKNIESGTHDLVIRGLPGFQVEVSGEGDVASRKVDLTKKKYEFYCSIPGHEEAGMKGTITVS
jgi:plastocyanin